MKLEERSVKVIKLLLNGGLGSSAVFDLANQLSLKDQSEWGDMIVKRAVEMAISEVVAEEIESKYFNDQRK